MLEEYDIEELNRLFLEALPVAYKTLTGEEKHFTCVPITEKTYSDLYDCLLKRLSENVRIDLASTWMYANFHSVEHARSTVFELCPESDFLFDFRFSSISETSSTFELDKFVKTLERYLNSPLFQLVKATKARAFLPGLVCYVGSSHFNYLWKNGFFDQFDSWEVCTPYTSEAPELFGVTDAIYGLSETPEKLLKAVKSKLSPVLQQRVFEKDISDPWQLLDKLKQVLAKVKEISIAELQMFQYPSKMKPGEFEAWITKLIMTHRDIVYLNNQPPEYFTALNNHLSCMFGRNMGHHHLTDTPSTLAFFKDLEGAKLGKDRNIDPEFLKMEQELESCYDGAGSRLCRACGMMKRQIVVHEKKDCPMKDEIPDYDNFWPMWKKYVFYGPIYESFKKEKIEEQNKMAKRNPNNLDFEKLITDYFAAQKKGK